MSQSPPDIFLSYSRKDTAMMRRVKASLEAEGFNVWTDEGSDMQPGTPDWTLSIQNAIDSVGCLAVLLSPESSKSRWVREELHYADSQKKRIYPVVIRADEADASDALIFGYTLAQRIDLRTDYAANMAKLTLAIAHYLKIEIVSQKQAAEEQHQHDAEQARLAKAEEQRQHEAEQARVAQLAFSPYDPLNGLHLLWWILMDPASLSQYRLLDKKYPSYIQQTADRLFSSLLFSTLLVPSLATAIGHIPISEQAQDWGWEIGVFQVMSGLIILAWLLMGIFGYITDNPGCLAFILLIIIGVVVAGLVGLSAVVAGFIGISVIAISIGGIGTVHGVGGLVPISIGSGVGGIGSIVGANIGQNLAGDIGAAGGIIIGFIVGIFISFIFIILLAMPINSAIEGRRANFFTRTYFVLIVASYPFLIWVYWLGGWRVLGLG